MRQSLICIFIIFIIIVIIFVIRFKKEEFKEQEYHKEKGSIFVSIASYRDLECFSIINLLYKNARDPDLVYVGLCQQNKDDIENCNITNKNVRTISIPWSSAKGPTYARYLCSTLWSGQEYYLQIDSHIYFRKDWDYYLKKMIEECPNPDKTVLSTYPCTKDQIEDNMIPIIDSWKKSNNGLPSFLATLKDIKSPIPVNSGVPFCSAGYLFLKASFLKDIPYDDSLDHLFQGEELLFSLRLFTFGYTVYAPNINICYHTYSRKGPLFWKDIKDHNEYRKKTEERVKDLFYNKKIKDYKYGIGTIKSLEDFMKFLK